MSSIAILFPGQGSQSLGMMKGFEHIDIVRETFKEAQSCLNIDLWELQIHDSERMNQTEITQPLMLTANIAIYRWLISQHPELSKDMIFAGHSLGEYSALVATQAISFQEALSLVTTRAKLMQEAIPEGQGTMAAILGIPSNDIIDLCQNITNQGLNYLVEAVNFNTPEQTVIAGTCQGVAQAIDALKQHGAKRCVTLPVSVPSHSSLLRSASELFLEHLRTIFFSVPKYPLYHNVDAQLHPSPSDFPELLAKQISTPVLWVNTIEKIHQIHQPKLWIECGPGKIISGMLKRFSFLKGSRLLSLDQPIDNIEKLD
jgi:[acyl-carrier-protein] S-malonyltransferase